MTLIISEVQVARARALMSQLATNSISTVSSGYGQSSTHSCSILFLFERSTSYVLGILKLDTSNELWLVLIKRGFYSILPDTRVLLVLLAAFETYLAGIWAVSLVDQTAPFPSTGCIASPALGREGLATVARFSWHRTECGYDQ